MVLLLTWPDFSAAFGIESYCALQYHYCAAMTTSCQNGDAATLTLFGNVRGEAEFLHGFAIVAPLLKIC
jgi:hypothetical protein